MNSNIFPKKTACPTHYFFQYIPQNALRLLAFCVLCMSGPLLSCAQDGVSGPWVHVDSITMEGNKKTRARLILREMEFGPGDSILVQELEATLERNRLRLLNLALFNTVKFEQITLQKNGHIKLHITFIESWYIFPVPLFEIADRNFNVWWKEMNRSFRRVNIGLDCNHLNLSGNADLLKLKGQGGYANKMELAYRKPNINKKQTLGLNSSITYNRQREIAVRTDRNKLDFRRNPDVWQIEQWHLHTSLAWRPGLFNSQTFALEFRHNSVTDSVAKEINPDFFLNKKTTQQHFSAIYNFVSDYRDVRSYPWNGHYIYTELRVNGLLPTDDLHLTRIFGEYFRFVPLHKRVSFEAGFKARASLPRRKPPYFNNQGLGYGGTFVRGYEYYVVDGLDFGMLRSALHFRFVDRVFHLPKWLPKFARRFPIQLHLSVNNDLGYVNDPYYAARNPLSNTWLWGNGIGLDIVAYNNKTARLEYTRNHLGQWGFYVQANTGI
jgi:Omp85 superfamily domain/Surface antigen variable number repeat